MKSRFRHNILLGLMLVAAFVSLVPTAVFASGASAYLTPASGTAQIGSSFTVSVDGKLGAYWWGGGPSSANGTINFPANLLKVTGYDDKTDATFPYSATTIDNSNGSITFSQHTASWTYTNANADAHLLTITFQTLASGTANVQFSSMSYSTGSAATSGGAYTIPAPPAPSPSPTPKPSTAPVTTKPKSSPTPTPTPSPSPSPTPEETPASTSTSDGDLKIADVKATTTRSENSLSWSLNSTAATQIVSYGTAKDKLTDAGTITKLDDGTYKLSFNNLRLGTLYYYMIKATASDGLQGATYSGILTTRGYPVVLTIQQGGLLLPGAKVVIAGRSFVADKDALVTTEVSDGTITATVTAPDSSNAQSVTFVVKKLTIPANGNLPSQSFTLDIPPITTASQSTTSLLPAIIGGSVVTLTLLGGGIGFLMMRKRQAALLPVDVDTGQLAETYGDRVTRPMANTPEPNLEAEYVNPVADTVPDTATQQIENTPITENATQEEQQIQAPAEAPAPQPQPSFDPASLPLPTTPQDTPQVDPTVIDTTPPIDSELLGQEINQVEASEEPLSDEPSAVYDEATGELAIIHHHDTPATAPAAVPSSPQPQSPAVAPQPLTPPQQGLMA